MMDRRFEPWVCAVRVEYADGSVTHRVIHRGAELECERLASLVPASTVEVDPVKVPPSVAGEQVAPLQMIEVPQPEGKIATGATVVVCRESMLA
jgi:hypothetical protein